MFKFFTKRWVSRKDYEEKLKELEFDEIQARHQIQKEYFEKENKFLNIINEKEKTIQRLELILQGLLELILQRLELMLMDDWEREVAELNGTLGKPKDQGLIPFCIEELERLNEKLQGYTPFNPEIQECTMQEVIHRLATEMQIQNNVLIMALRALMGKTEK